MIKDRINQKEAYIVLDTNVLLNIYRYPEEFFEFTIFCIKEIIDYIVLPKTVCIEYDKHRKKEFSKYIKKYEFFYNDYRINIEKFYEKMINELKGNKNLDKFDDLSNFIKEVNKNRNELLNKFDIFTDKYIKYFNTIVDSYKKKDFVYDDIYSNIVNKLSGLQQEAIYNICENGRYRYKKKVGPGYMDAEKKDGIDKYSDLILWEEIIYFSKLNNCDIIFVSNDNKEDWFNNKEEFRSDLQQEFINRTNKKIYAYNSKDFFDIISKEYNIPKSEPIDCILDATNIEYCERISNKVFEVVRSDIECKIEDLINADGDTEVDINDFEYDDCNEIITYDDRIEYYMLYSIKSNAITQEYLGRDDDTKEEIFSPYNNYEISGNVEIKIIRNKSINIDFAIDDNFISSTLNDCHFEIDEFKHWTDEDL